MTRAAEQDKQMKYGVVEFYFLDAVKDSARRIGNTPSEKPEQSLGGQTVDQWLYGKNDNPAHEYIHQGR